MGTTWTFFFSEGLEVLGSPIGSDAFIKNFALEKFNKIAKMIDLLREIAKTHQQQAFAVLNRSIKFKATFFSVPYQTLLLMPQSTTMP